MNRFAFLFALALAPACGDDAVKPGNLIASWAHGGPIATCSSRGVTTVEARLYSGTNLIANGSAPCEDSARTGTVALADIKPGTYRLVLEAIDADDKGLYLGEVARQNVKEGATTTSAEVTLAPKPGRLIVDWKLPGGGRCASNDISQVEVNLYYNANAGGAPIKTQKVSCEHTFKSPDDGSDVAGILFDKLDPNDDVVLEAFGYDASNAKVASALSEIFEVGIGDELEPVLQLTLCPESGCP